jgi:hypothetical protein
LKRITLEEAKKLAERRGLKPARLKGTEIISFVRDYGTRYAPLSWEELEKLVKENEGEIYESNGWIKIT